MKEIIGDATLYLGDCSEILPTLDKVDAVVTDPPYADKTHKGARTGNGNDVLIDFDHISNEQAIEFAKHFVSIATGWVVMTCDWMHTAEIAREMPDEFIRAGVWIKPNGMPQFTGDRPAMGWESVAMLHRKGKKEWNGGGRHAVWNVPKVHGNHPTEKPIALIESFVDLFSNREATILDPFMGSGTTGVACMNLQRKFIGIEREQKYFDIACKRIEQAQKQERLF
jgi:site-specific DNA-methyltransferase (adenine-specific)